MCRGHLAWHHCDLDRARVALANSLRLCVLLPREPDANGAVAVYHHVAEQEFSSILTMAVIVQALASVFMCVQVITSNSAAGVSARGLTLDTIAVALRLS